MQLHDTLSSKDGVHYENAPFGVGSGGAAAADVAAAAAADDDDDASDGDDFHEEWS